MCVKILSFEENCGKWISKNRTHWGWLTPVRKQIRAIRLEHIHTCTYNIDMWNSSNSNFLHLLLIFSTSISVHCFFKFWLLSWSFSYTLSRRGKVQNRLKKVTERKLFTCTKKQWKMYHFWWFLWWKMWKNNCKWNWDTDLFCLRTS